MQMDKSFPEDRSKSGTWIDAEKCDAFDYDKLMQRLGELAARRGLRIEDLGDIEGYPLLLLTPITLNEGPRVLFAAGFHGDEPAGCWGITRFLNSLESFHSLTVSFLPLVNPTGFRNHTRTNIWGEDPNRGFFHSNPTIHRRPNEPLPSREGQILLRHLPLLTSLASHGFLSLHEDMEYLKCYLYTFETSPTPGLFSHALRAEAAKFFEFFPDGPLEGGFVREGIIFDYRDGSFEDLLFHSGIPRTACTEIPGLADINKRVEADSRLITALARFVLAQSE